MPRTTPLVIGSAEDQVELGLRDERPRLVELAPPRSLVAIAGRAGGGRRPPGRSDDRFIRALVGDPVRRAEATTPEEPDRTLRRLARCLAPIHPPTAPADRLHA